MKKRILIIATVLVILVFLTILLLKPEIFKKEIPKKEIGRHVCEFNFNVGTSELQNCVEESEGKHLTVIINNLVLSNNTIPLQLNYNMSNTNSRLDTSLKLYLAGKKVYEDNAIDDEERLHDIAIFKDEVVILYYDIFTELKMEGIGNLVVVDSRGTNIFELAKEEDVYYRPTNISEIENKIYYDKITYTYVADGAYDVITESYEMDYLGQGIFNTPVLKKVDVKNGVTLD